MLVLDAPESVVMQACLSGQGHLREAAFSAPHAEGVPHAAQFGSFLTACQEISQGQLGRWEDAEVTFGDRLRAVLGDTPHKAVAAELEVKPSTFSGWVNARWAPPIDTVKRIADAATRVAGREIHWQTLIEGIDPKPSRKSRKSVTQSVSQLAHTGPAGAGETRGRQEDTAVDRLLGTVRHYLEQMSVEDQNKAGVHFLEYLQTLDSFPSGDTPGRRVANQH